MVSEVWTVVYTHLRLSCDVAISRSAVVLCFTVSLCSRVCTMISLFHCCCICSHSVTYNICWYRNGVKYGVAVAVCKVSATYCKKKRIVVARGRTVRLQAHFFDLSCVGADSGVFVHMAFYLLRIRSPVPL